MDQEIDFWESKKVIVIGSDGKIGKELVAQLMSRGALVVGTSRKPIKHFYYKQIYLDLSEEYNHIDFSLFDIAIICAGITNIDSCRKNPSKSNAVNVHFTIKLLNLLDHAQVKSVFLSSNQVFDPKKSFPGVHDRINPRNDYAKQKAQVEEVIFRQFKNATVLRLTKFMEKDGGVISHWRKEILAGGSISVFQNVCVSYIDIHEIVNACQYIFCATDPSQLFHIGGKVESTYYDLCIERFIMEGLSTTNIIRVIQGDGELVHNSLASNVTP